MPDWRQNALDAEAILCEAGDLLRQCHEVLRLEGEIDLADKVKAFCSRVEESMNGGKPFTGRVSRMEEACKAVLAAWDSRPVGDSTAGHWSQAVNSARAALEEANP